jgi:hypothetical protein
MNSLFISKDILIRNTYRRDKWFRLAGAVILAALLAQIAVAYCLIGNGREKSALESRQQALQAENAAATKEKQSVAQLEKQAGELKGWGTILRNRLPSSAILALVEQTIPKELDLSKLELDTTLKTAVNLPAGAYAMPRLYRLTLNGEQKGDDPGATKRFAEALLAKLPPTSREVTHKLSRADPHGLAIFNLVLEVPADGNYFNLGLIKVQQAESL